MGVVLFLTSSGICVITKIVFIANRELPASNMLRDIQNPTNSILGILFLQGPSPITPTPKIQEPHNAKRNQPKA